MRCCRFHDLICFGEIFGSRLPPLHHVFFFSAGDAFFETTVFLMPFSVTLIWALRWTIGPSFLRCLGQLRDVGVRIHHFVTSKSLIPEAQDASLRVFKMFFFSAKSIVEMHKTELFACQVGCQLPDTTRSIDEGICFT